MDGGKEGRTERGVVDGERVSGEGWGREGDWSQRGGCGGGWMEGGIDGFMDVLLTPHLLGIQALVSLPSAEFVSGLHFV